MTKVQTFRRGIQVSEFKCPTAHCLMAKYPIWRYLTAKYPTVKCPSTKCLQQKDGKIWWPNFWWPKVVRTIIRRRIILQSNFWDWKLPEVRIPYVQMSQNMVSMLLSNSRLLFLIQDFENRSWQNDEDLGAAGDFLLDSHANLTED